MMLNSPVNSQNHEKYSEFEVVSNLLLFYLARIRPICLPVNEPLRSQILVDQNPYVAGSLIKVHVCYVLTSSFLIYCFVLHRFALGWGSVSKDGLSSPYLKHVQVPIISTDVCREIFRKHGTFKYENISDMHICAGIHRGQNSCYG